ncbi:MAG: tetratricopeptide repeat protein [Limisphaerales bacterium]
MPRPTPSPARRRWFRLAAAVLLPLLALALAEAGLRVAGYGYPTSFLLRADDRGRAVWLENDRFGWRFFPPAIARTPPPIKFPVAKPPGTVRLFVLGESAALGDPQPAYGLGRQLEVLLAARHPGTRFEVVTVAMTAVNSHALRETARDLARADGDLWLVYAGNNEMLGPFGAGGVFGASAPALPLVRAGLGLQRLRLGQAAAALLRRTSTNAPAGEWEGLRRLADVRIAPDDPARVRVHGNFRANLDALLTTARSAGVPVLLAPAVVNLRDCPPFAAVGSDLEAARAAREKAASDAPLHEAAGDLAALQAAWQAAAAVDPRHADTRYRLAQAELALTNTPAALAAFGQSRDDDALPLRADAAVARTMGDLAAGRPGVAFLDLPAEVARLAPQGVPGNEFFYEHVHPTPDGTFLFAMLLAREAEKLLPAAARAASPSPWPSGEAVAAALARTPWNDLSGFEQMQARVRQPPFTAQANSDARLRVYAAQVAALRRAATPAARDAALLTYSNALAARPDDPWLWRGRGEFLELAGDAAAAAASWDRAAELVPHHPVAWFQAGRLHARAGSLTNALARLETALARRPDFPDAALARADVLVRQGRGPEAVAGVEAALRRSPANARLQRGLAETLAAAGRRAEAVAALRRLVALAPEDGEAVYLLGVELALDGSMAEAEAAFRRAAALRPGFALAHLNLGVTLARQRRFEEAEEAFGTAVRLDPDSRAAREGLEKARLFRRGAMPR